LDAIGRSSTLTRVDLSSNALGEEAGRLVGAALMSNNYLVDLNLAWNSLRAKGGAAVAEALKSNR
jgi:Ran GTPase-activating protein (RanGAP) involved in mRNA processing and transport